MQLNPNISNPYILLGIIVSVLFMIFCTYKVFKKKTYIKKTILKSYLASGDGECFCWSKYTSSEHKEIQAHYYAIYDQFDKEHPEFYPLQNGTREQWEVYYQAKDQYMKDHNVIDDDDGRIYPHHLLPNKTQLLSQDLVAGKQELKGKWTIVVKFEPEDK